MHRRARLCYSILWASELTSLNYPFDFAFFAHVTPGRCPTEKVPEIFIPLPVAEVVVDLGVAGLTKAHEVVPCVSTAFGNGQNVVNFLYRS